MVSQTSSSAQKEPLKNYHRCEDIEKESRLVIYHISGRADMHKSLHYDYDGDRREYDWVYEDPVHFQLLLKVNEWGKEQDPSLVSWINFVLSSHR